MNACDAFLNAFSKVTGTGDFHSTGQAPFFLPGIEVEGLGELAFPLPASQVKELIPLAEAAPYGLGEKTVLDESVRKCWQLDAAQLSFKAPEWQEFLGRTVACVREDLGVEGRISAIPYKLLIYGKGGHFRAHRDTEKLDAMFGTLIISLPSAHEGGRLFVRHDGREVEVDFSRETRAFQHAAFFADCEHEVELVRSGFRCCLVYNLRLDAGDPGKLNLSQTAQARTLLAPLKTLLRSRAGALTAVLLEHGYTEANLTIRNLKGHDQSRARALFAASEEAGAVAHLALVTFHQSGELRDGYGYGRRRYGYDDDDPEDGEMGEIYEEDLSVEHWRNASDRSVALGIYRIEPDDLISKEKLGEGEPDEKEAEGFTGNAGCTMDHWYRRAAVVLWAKEDHEGILCRHDFKGACAALADLASTKNTGPDSPFHRLGEAVIGEYPESRASGIYHSAFRDAEGHPFSLALGAIAKAGSRDLLGRFITNIDPAHFVLCDAKLWSRLFKAFGVEAFAPVCENLINGGVEENRRAIFQLLDALLKSKEADSWAGAIAGQLVALAPAAPRHGYDNRSQLAPGDREETRILLAASHLLADEEDRQAAVTFLRGESSLAYVRETLGPVLLEKSVQKILAVKTSLAPEILAFAKNLLAAEVARPLNPYPDWARPGPQPDVRTYGPIRELLAFMADPAAETHRFTRTQGERELLENFIRQHALDLDFVTITKGRPYTLFCTKNDNSHQRALARRAKDEELLGQLGR
ncbi:MAG: 2OG-Fe(II) oxygenase [Verrucomicrobia bacterium]|nr:2OG-Fe(II) oxygenase [Verrucomicrobiota bacterium]